MVLIIMLLCSLLASSGSQVLNDLCVRVSVCLWQKPLRCSLLKALFYFFVSLSQNSCMGKNVAKFIDLVHEYLFDFSNSQLRSPSYSLRGLSI